MQIQMCNVGKTRMTATMILELILIGDRKELSVDENEVKKMRER